MIEPLTSLTFSVYSGKGIYALLVGSGLSRSAEIPTGWEITIDLIRKVATVEGDECETDPARWYLEKFGKEPDYSFLLEKLAATQAERTNILSGYFEATAEDRNAGKKTPTLAHKTIARLVAEGYFRVIVTTNFDRLIEQALEAEGVSATIISTPDMARGAIPLAHAGCTLIKVHGDYRDTRLKNTSTELSTYDPEMDKLLDRVFDEYGLIVCGWSTTWDLALRAAFLRCPNRRFSVFWAIKGTLSPEADGLVKFRQASLIPIESADNFFATLGAKIDALQKYDAPHPLSAAIAVASLKRLIVDEHSRIELHDLVMGELDRQIGLLSPLSVQSQSPNLPCDVLLARVQRYESSMEIMLNLMAYGCYWGTSRQAPLWVQVILRMLDISPPLSGSGLLLNLRRYPACMLFYAGGIAAVASRNYATLQVLLRNNRTSIDRSVDGKDDLLIRKLVPIAVLDGNAINNCSGQRFKTPASERLHSLLRGVLRPFLPNDLQYDDEFDRFEYLFSLVYFHEGEKDGRTFGWAPLGRFLWRHRLIVPSDAHISQTLTEEHKKEGGEWGPIKAGLFDSSDTFVRVEEEFRKNVLSAAPAF
jgi:hypothetical protein